MTTQPLRPEPASHFKTFVKRTMVAALRAVFTDQYPNKEFRNLEINLEYPQKKITNSFILVKFNVGAVMNAGVGHEELLFDSEGVLRKYHHSRFEGSVEFHLYTLSSLSQDLLSDALVEIVRHGKLQELTNQFYEQLFDEYDNGGQLMFQSDVMTDLGSSVGPPFWQPEDTLLYVGGWAVNCEGGFFSTGTDELAAFLRTVVVYPYIEGNAVPVGEITSTVPWAPPFPAAEDEATITSRLLITGDEDYTPAP